MRVNGALAGIGGLSLIFAWAGVASAAETIGQNGVAVGCTDNRPYVQAQLAGGRSYSPSSYGVITSWSAVADSTPNRTLRLIVQQPNPFGGPKHYITTQKDEVRTLALASQLNTFTGVRLPIEAAERIGLHVPVQADSSGPCVFAAESGDILGIADGAGDPPPGMSLDYPHEEPGFRLNVSAVVEPDADRDEFGDETQDCDPADPARAQDCVAPNAEIVKGPPNKTSKRKATIEFTGTDARAIASFQCKLDAAAFAACTSPYKVKVKKGKHTVQVRAVDQAGNVDPTPASDSWKVKKKRR